MKIKKFNLSQTSINASHRKEKYFSEGFKVVALRNNEFKEVLDLRLYSTNTTEYACIWIKGSNYFSGGSGKAGGYGYHKSSVAVSEAMRKAGIEFDYDFGGAGENSTIEAIKLIIKKLGFRKFTIVKCHG